MKSILPGVKCVCPSCFEEIFLGECDIVSGKMSGKILKRGSKGALGRMKVPPLDGPEYTLEKACRQCTNCDYYLPYNIELVPSITLVVVGDTFSGKSHYIAALIQQLQTEWIGRTTGFARFTCLTPVVEKKFIDEYFEPLFALRKQIVLTQPTIRSTAEPLIYNMTSRPSPRHPATSYNLMIYDASGEDYREDRLVNVARFVLNTNAFIFVADPFTMPPLTQKLHSTLQSQLQPIFAIVQKRRTVANLNDAIKVFERYRGYGPGSTLPETPVAVMLSKSDLLKSVQPSISYNFLRNPTYGSELDLHDINRIDQEVKEVLMQYDQQDLLAATRHFRHVKFFATSATGEPPDLAGNFQQVKPCRCLDPFLWILYSLRLVKGS